MKKRTLILMPVLFSVFLCSCSGGGETSGSSAKPVLADGVTTFRNARKNTMDSIQYQYDFNLTAKIKFKDAINFSPATYSGTTYVNTGASGTQFLQKRSLTGALVIDSTNYIYNVGTDLVKISADEEKDFSVINHEQVDSIYDFDKHNFSYILKELNDNNVLKADFNNGKYDLSLHTNFNQDSLLGMLNLIDSKTIIKALNGYTKDKWGVGFEVNTWATLNSDKTYLDTFHFDASVNIKDAFEIGFEFEQKFTKYAGVSITLPSFTNTIVEENAVKTELNNVLSMYNASKEAATSYYKYDVKTTVDHGVSRSNPLGLAVNSRTQGFTKRQIIGNTVYFNNRLLVDSDYKNGDQLGNLVKDYDSYRARLNDGSDTVYDVLDPKVGFNQYDEITDYNESSIDEYYMLPESNMISFDNFKVVKKTQDKKSNNVYKFGLSNATVKNLLAYYNKTFRMDYTRATIFDVYKIDTDFVAKKAMFTITTNSDNKLESLDIDLKGFYTEKDSGDQVKFRLEVEIDYDWSKTYTAVTTKEDIDNN